MPMGHFGDEKCMINLGRDCFLPWAFRGISIVVQIVPLKHKVKTHTKKDHMKEDEESSQTHDNNIPNNILEAVLQL